jgi:hypothetical protein
MIRSRSVYNHLRARPPESAMSLTQEDIDFIKTNMPVWLVEQNLGKLPAVYEIELRERMVRVEEELKHQRELMRQGFEQMDKRLAAMQANMDKRLEQVERRLETLQADRQAFRAG